MDLIRRMSTRFSSTSYDIFGLQSYEASDKSWAKHIPDIIDDHPYFFQPEEELLSQTVTDPVGASTIVHQQLENHTQQRSYELSILTRESPKFAGLELPHLSMAKKNPQALNTSDSHKKLTEMNLIRQPMTPLSGPGHTAMSDAVNVEQAEKTFELMRTGLDTGMDDICSFDSPAIISIHDTCNLQSVEDTLGSEEELIPGHDQQLITPEPPKQGFIKMPDDKEIQQFVDAFKKRRFQLESSADGIQRIKKQFSSTTHDTFDNDIVVSGDVLKHDIIDVQFAFSPPKEQPSSQVVTDPVPASIEAHHRLQQYIKKHPYKQQIRTQEPSKSTPTMPPNFSTAMPTQQSFSIASEQNGTSQMIVDNLCSQILAEHSVSCVESLPSPTYENITDEEEFGELKNIFHQIQLESDQDIDGICSFDPQGMSDLRSQENGVDSGQEIKLYQYQQQLGSQRVSELTYPELSYSWIPKQSPHTNLIIQTQNQSLRRNLAQQSELVHPEPRQEDMLDVSELVRSEKFFHQKEVELESNVDVIQRIGTQVTSTTHDISHEDRVDWGQDFNLGNIKRDLMCQVSRETNSHSVQTAFYSPNELLSSQPVADSFAASEPAHKKLHQHTEQLSYRQHTRTKEPSKPLPSAVFHFPMCMETQQPLVNTHSLKETSYMSLVNNYQSKPKPPKLAPLDTKEKEDLQQFVKTFKKRRIELGMTPRDVSLSIRKREGGEIVGLSIIRFENFNLRFEDMLRHKAIFQRWLQDIDTLDDMISHNLLMARSKNTSVSCIRRRNFPNSLDPIAKQSLENFYITNSNPASKEIAMLADLLDVRKEAVTRWFKTRRQMEKKKKNYSASFSIPHLSLCQ